MKKFKLNWIPKRVFTIITDVFPQTNTLFLNIKLRIRTSVNNIKVYVKQLFKLQIKFNTELNNIKFVGNLYQHIKQNINIKAQAILQSKVILHQKINQSIRILSDITQNVRFGAVFNNRLKFDNKLTAILQGQYPNKPNIIHQKIKIVCQAIARKFRKLLNLGYIDENNEKKYMIQVGGIDDLKLSDIDDIDVHFIYWGDSMPTVYQPLYSTNTGINDVLKRSISGWTITYNTREEIINGKQKFTASESSTSSPVIIIYNLQVPALSTSQFQISSQFLTNSPQSDAYYKLTSDSVVQFTINRKMVNDMKKEFPSIKTNIQEYMVDWFNYKPMKFIYQIKEATSITVDDERTNELNEQTKNQFNGELNENIKGVKQPINPSEILGLGSYGLIIQERV